LRYFAWSSHIPTCPVTSKKKRNYDNINNNVNTYKVIPILTGRTTKRLMKMWRRKESARRRKIRPRSKYYMKNQKEVLVKLLANVLLVMLISLNEIFLASISLLRNWKFFPAFHTYTKKSKKVINHCMSNIELIAIALCQIYT
jgi:hypothetical protein